MLLLLCAIARPAGAEPTLISLKTGAYESSRPLPKGFLGFSFEKSQITSARFRASNVPLVKMVRLLGAGTLRLGGNTVDTAALDEGQADDSGSHESYSPGDIKATIELARACDWSLIYGLNLGTGRPQQAATEANLVWSLGRDRVLAFEVGNEPDMFVLQKLRGDPWDVSTYLRQFQRYRQALPGLPISGPGVGVIYDSPNWVVPFLKAEGQGLAFASAHFYPTVARTEFPADSPLRPTAQNLLSPEIADYIATRLFTPDIRAAQEAGIPFRVTEANTAARGGQAGVSNSFVSALWGVDTTMRLLSLGADGIDFQTDLLNANDLYTPFLETDGKLEARPLFYGMLLLAQLRPGSLTTMETGHPEVTAYSVVGDRGAQIVLVNKSQTSFRVQIASPQRPKKATLLELEGTSLASPDTRLGGATVTTQGEWQPAYVQLPHDGTPRFQLEPASAVLVDLSS